MIAPARFALVLFSMLAAACTGTVTDHPPGHTDPDAGARDAGRTVPDAGPSAEPDSGTGPIDETPDAGPVVTQPMPVTELPPLPTLTNLDVRVTADSVAVRFDAVEGAKDYRIYPLPTQDGGILVGADGRVTIPSAVYRCAGQREDLYVIPDRPGVNDNAAGGTTTVNGSVQGFTRAEADATLGHVYRTPGTGRIPVYVLGNAPVADGNAPPGGCGRPTFEASRVKTYTTDSAARAQALAGHARDLGVGFYAPASASSATRPVYGKKVNGDALVWSQGTEASNRGSAPTLFQVLTAPAADTVPLKRVHVEPYCANPHDELAVGTVAYLTARNQGDQPLAAVRWSGVTADTVLVVEALDQGCPFQGVLSPKHQAAHTDTGIDYPEFSTLAELAAKTATGEVFVNGQYASSNQPRAVARSFVKVTPGDAATWDFKDDFNSPMQPFTDLSDGTFLNYHFKSPTYDLYTTGNATYVVGNTLNEAWFLFGDWAADVGGIIRLAPLQKATLAANSYLHVTAEMDFLATGRRYTQLVISDRDAPAQKTMDQGKTLVIQPKDMGGVMNIEACDHRFWQVNDQCPLLPQYPTSFQPAVPVASELVGLDRLVKVDVYVSTQRLYLLLDDQPYSCTTLPAVGDDGHSYTAPNAGPVTVSFGAVMYHSGADFSPAGAQLDASAPSYRFTREKLMTLSQRHFDNFAFRSTVAAPANWNEELYPCVSHF
ncbi:MAG: hypothetical protein IPJ65_19010 [Archangiaceae bacterium]|nr:hypothetical protein [Archangiaceae bacterium]